MISAPNRCPTTDVSDSAPGWVTGEQYCASHLDNAPSIVGKYLPALLQETVFLRGPPWQYIFVLDYIDTQFHKHE